MIIRIESVVVARLVDPKCGRVVEEWETENFLTELGEAYLADRLSDRDEADGDISHMAIGTGTGQTRVDTTLDTESARVALEAGYPDQGTGSDDNQILWYAKFPAGTPASQITITEGALFSAVSSGTMINYFEFSPGRVKPTSLEFQCTLKWRLGAS